MLRRDMVEHAKLASRTVIKLSGEDRKNFLQGIITNDINKVSETNAIYALMLTPQGKFMFDFFIIERDAAFFIDAEKAKLDEILKKLKMYKLRSKVEIAHLPEYNVYASDSFEGGIFFKDPRFSGKMGSRAFIKGEIPGAKDEKFYDEKRIENIIPEGGKDLFFEKSFPMQSNMEEAGAIDFNKGCYVGQEVTARSKHRAQIRKKIIKLAASGPVKTHDPITVDSRNIGEVLSVGAGKILALVDFEEVEKNKNNLKSNNFVLNIA